MYQNNTSCDVHYHRLVGVSGDCNDRPDIVLFGNDVAFSAQDTTIRPVQCGGIRSLGNGSIAFASRQFAILDVRDVRIGQLAGGTVTSAQEMPKINCISGSVGYVAQGRRNVDGQRELRIQFREHATGERDRGCGKKILDPCESSFVVGAFFGEKYICTDSQIDGAATMTRNRDSSSVNCLVR